jgi:hypothetical protein
VKFEESRIHCVFRKVSKGKKGKFNFSHLEESIPSNTWLKVGFELVEEIFLKDSKPLNELNEKEMCELEGELEEVKNNLPWSGGRP